MYEDFYLSNQKGSDCSHIQSHVMQDYAKRAEPLTQAQFNDIIEAHHEFLASGGGGGIWHLFTVSGTVFGVYQHKLTDTRGKQAQLDMRHLSAALALPELDLPYSSWCGCYAKGLDWSDANLEASIFCDAYLERCIFADAHLANVDFSRANLRYASFMNANLTHADFENCDLTGADFTGAILKGAKFPGAKLAGIKR